MKVSFYQAIIHIIIEPEEMAHIFPNTEIANPLFLRIDGSWFDGLTVRADSVIENPAEYVLGKRYKLQLRSANDKVHTYLPVGWGSLGKLIKTQFDIPIHCDPTTIQTTVNNKPVLKVVPLKGVQLYKSSYTRAATEAKPVVRPYPTSQQTFNMPQTAREQPKTPVSPPYKPTVTTAIPQPKPVYTAPPSEPVTTNDKTIEEIKNLAAELNRVLETTPHLFVSIHDGKLVLEEEVEDYEEF